MAGVLGEAGAIRITRGWGGSEAALLFCHCSNCTTEQCVRVCVHEHERVRERVHERVYVCACGSEQACTHSLFSQLMPAA